MVTKTKNRTKAKGPFPGIRIAIDQSVMDRIAAGPLKATCGRGAATWARGLIMRELEKYENGGDGSVQSRELKNAMEEAAQ